MINEIGLGVTLVCITQCAIVAAFEPMGEVMIRVFGEKALLLDWREEAPLATRRGHVPMYVFPMLRLDTEQY